MADAQQLHRLQEVDTQIDGLQRRLQEIESSLIESTALKRAKTEFKEAQDAYQAAHATVTNLDLEVKSLQQKIRDHESRLYGGKVGPKEASALQDDIVATRKWLAGREDALLTAMMTLESAEETQQTNEAALSSVQAAWEEDQADLLQEQRQLRAALDEAGKLRQTRVQILDPGDLRLYESLRLQRKGLAVVLVEDEFCPGCGVTLPSNLIQRALNEDDLQFCEGCKRILYVV